MGSHNSDAGGRLQSPLARRWREKGYNAEELADELGVYFTHIYALAAGRKTPSFTLLKKLCQVLDARPDELFPELSPGSKEVGIRGQGVG